MGNNEGSRKQVSCLNSCLAVCTIIMVPIGICALLFQMYPAFFRTTIPMIIMNFFYSDKVRVYEIHRLTEYPEVDPNNPSPKGTKRDYFPERTLLEFDLVSISNGEIVNAEKYFYVRVDDYIPPPSNPPTVCDMVGMGAIQMNLYATINVPNNEIGVPLKYAYEGNFDYLTLEAGMRHRVVLELHFDNPGSYYVTFIFPYTYKSQEKRVQTEQIKINKPETYYNLCASDTEAEERHFDPNK